MCAKKLQNITGQLLRPLAVGSPAVIIEDDGVRRTSSVVNIGMFTNEEIHFETKNTKYVLAYQATRLPYQLLSVFRNEFEGNHDNTVLL